MPPGAPCAGPCARAGGAAGACAGVPRREFPKRALFYSGVYFFWAMALFPPEETALAFTKITEIRAFARLEEAPFAAWEARIGDLKDHVPLLALLQPDVVRAAATQARITLPASVAGTAPEGAAAPQSERQLGPLEASQVGLVWRIARRISLAKAGIPWGQVIDIDPLQEMPSSSAVVAPALPGPSPSTLVVTAAPKERAIKVSAVLDQGDDSEVRIASTAEHSTWIQNYISSALAPPPEECEPTLEQLSALNYRVTSLGLSPYADFAVWNPYGRKGLRAAKFRAWYPMGDGTFASKEVPGPENLVQWEASFRVFAVACIMLQIVGRASLDMYQDTIRRLVSTWPDCWHLVALADDKMRAEHVIRIKRNIEADIAGGRPPDPDWNAFAPWSCALRRAAQDDRFWDLQVRHPAVAWVARAGHGVGSELPARTLLPRSSRAESLRSSR